jgi:[ribosomal protein S5]-alanine N-acetyltransferase
VIDPVPRTHGIVLRELRRDDAAALAAAYLKNRAHLAAWEPVRDDVFFTHAGQQAEIDGQLESALAGGSLPLVLEAGDEIIGRFTLTGIVRGPFQSANLGYWVDEDRTGHGVATSAVAAIVRIARDDLGLHRVQAATLPHNTGSQRVLARNGFTRIGFAPKYLKIAGRWQDHDLFQVILHD